MKNIFVIERVSIIDNIILALRGSFNLLLTMRPRIKTPIISSRNINKRVEMSSLTAHVVKRHINLEIPKDRDFYNEKNEHCIRIL